MTTPEVLTLEHQDKTLSVRVERNVRAKRIRLKVDRKTRQCVLVLPKKSSVKTGVLFAKSQAEWISNQLNKLPAEHSFADGISVCFLGNEVVLHHSPLAKRGVWIDENVVWVSGNEEHFSRRVKDFFKKQFKEYALMQARIYAKELSVNVVKITVKDTFSRWGSCNQKGHISLSWRLSLAPLYVLRYVVLHEVVHLREMNHSDKFWKLVASMCPEYKQAELWLKQNASYLHSFKA